MKKLTTARSLTLVSGIAALRNGGSSSRAVRRHHLRSNAIGSRNSADRQRGEGACVQAQQIAQGSQTNLTLIQQLTKTSRWLRPR